MFKLLNYNIIIYLAVIRYNIILIGCLLKLINKLLLLKFFAFKDNPRFQKTTSCSYGFEKASPSARLEAFEEGLPLGIAAADNQGIQA